ncbi:MAG: hypothetical protein C0391_03280 [Anaerolinea sp.]|nr:hypothetical protein [Anaerolinea sp.]
MRKKRFWFLGCGLILVIIIFFVAILFTVAGHFLVYRDPLKKADVIVILSGGGIERLTYGAQLVDDGIAKRIILTETGETAPDSTELESKANLDLLANKYDILKTRINVPRGTVSSTYEEAKVVLALMQKRDWESLVIVTDSFHSRRTSMIFNRIFSGSGIRLSVQPVDVPDYWYHPWYWWKDAKSRQATLLEYLKIIYFLAGRYE